MIKGNFEKIKQFDLNNLEKIIGKSFKDGEFISQELLKILSVFVVKYNTSLGVVLNRNGEVNNFFVGDSLAEIEVEETNKGLNGLRIIICKSKDELKILPIEKNILKTKSFDALGIVNYLDGFKGALVLLNTDKESREIHIEKIEDINKIGLIEKIEENDKEIKKNFNNIYDTKNEEAKAILVAIGRRGEDIDISLDELVALCDSDNIKVVGKFKQTRKFPDPQYHIGNGKLDEIKALIASLKPNFLIFDNELTGLRLFNLEEALNIKVIDRSMLILDIFAKRATSNEGRMQVNLAQMKYSYPRIIAYQSSNGRFGSGGVGMRGPGETKMELSKRILKDKIFDTEKQIDKLKQQRELRREKRKDNREKVVAIVGYTNSGKSSLMNKLTNAQCLAEDKLFATLDTTTRECYLDDKTKILLVDTVGFINKLPHEFINAFASTLEESIDSDLLLIVVDNAHVQVQQQYDVVEKVLEELKANNIPKLVVANKIDKKGELSFKAKEDVVMISAKFETNLDVLRKKIKKMLF